MQPNIAVEWLRLLVDPADSSYMPTLLVISGGDTPAKMHELNTVRVTPSDTWVTLLRSVKEVSGVTINMSELVVTEDVRSSRFQKIRMNHRG